MQSKNSRVKKILLAAVIAASTLSGASMALPQPPDGALLVVEYYDAYGTHVGSQVYGTCFSGPYPLTWGIRTSNRAISFYQCDPIWVE